MEHQGDVGSNLFEQRHHECKVLPEEHSNVYIFPFLLILTVKLCLLVNEKAKLKPRKILSLYIMQTEGIH